MEKLRELIPDFAKDIRINLSGIFSANPQSKLSKNQLYGTLLACAYACKNSALIHVTEETTRDILSDAEIQAAKSAACIMAMNNVYYRSMGQISDEAFKKLPAGLRMQVIGKPGIDKLDFELYCLAVSAINGCGTCVNAHVTVSQKSGVSNPDIQIIIKLASIVNAINTSVLIH